MTRRRLAAWWLILRLGIPYLVVLRLAAWFPRSFEKRLQKTHAWGAGVLYRFIVQQGGLLIKVGQYIASRPDIFPSVYIDHLGSLRDAIPPRSLDELRPTLDAAYDGKCSQHLQYIEPTALASASFGQVHRATTVDGHDVAVKIQYPNLRPGVLVDIATVRSVTWLLKPLLPGWPLDYIAEEIERSSNEELDYLYEGRNGDVLRKGLAEQGLRVPQIYWQHSREKVLVMEFVPGQSLAHFPIASLPESARFAIAETLIDGFLCQLLQERFFHADPHAGNIILDVHDDWTWDLWLLDFGMTARLEVREAELYGRFLLCLQRDDTDGMVDILEKLGYVLPGANKQALKDLAREVYGELGHMNPLTLKGSRRQADLAGKINSFMRKMKGLSFPRHTLLLSRASGLIEGLCMELVPERNVLDLIRPRLTKVLNWQTQLGWFAELLKDRFEQWQRIPDHIQSLQQRIDEVAERDDGVMLIVWTMAFFGSMLLPEDLRWWVAAGAALAFIITLRRRLK